MVIAQEGFKERGLREPGKTIFAYGGGNRRESYAPVIEAIRRKAPGNGYFKIY